MKDIADALRQLFISFSPDTLRDTVIHRYKIGTADASDRVKLIEYLTLCVENGKGLVKSNAKQILIAIQGEKGNER